MEKKILFLDFDGVLFDTIKEAYLINRFLYNGTGFFDVLDKKNFELFSKYKYLVYNIWMFYYYNQIIFKCENENVVEESFKNLLLRRDIKKEDAFCREFLNLWQPIPPRGRCRLRCSHRA